MPQTDLFWRVLPCGCDEEVFHLGGGETGEGWLSDLLAIVRMRHYFSPGMDFSIVSRSLLLDFFRMGWGQDLLF